MDLNTILIILGIIALIGLVGHGIWSNRREKSLYFDNANTFSRETARTTLKSADSVTPDFAQQPQGQALQQENQPEQQVLSQNMVNAAQVYTQNQATQSVNDIRITIPNMPSMSQPVTVQTEQIPTPVINEPVHYEYQPEIKQPAVNLSERSLDELARFAETDEGIHVSSPDIRVSLQENIGASSPISSAKPVEPVVSIAPEPQVTETVAEDYIMLYVVAAENRQFQGSQLHQVLERDGFILGHDALYHRHLDLTVASPVIFSVANVNQPGSFPIYNMHEFSTVGVVMYMQLPSPGNNRVNLKTMLKSAKNLAAQLDGFVLTDNEQELDANAEQDYLARV